MSFSRRLLSVAAVCGAAAVTAFAGPAASASDADDDDVISGLPLGGPTAAQVLEVLNLEDRYAATVDVSGEELLDLLRTENGLFLAEDGLLGYAEPAMPSAATETAIPTNTAAATATADDAFALNSSPEAASTIFLTSTAQKSATTTGTGRTTSARSVPARTTSTATRTVSPLLN